MIKIPNSRIIYQMFSQYFICAFIFYFQKFFFLYCILIFLCFFFFVNFSTVTGSGSLMVHCYTLKNIPCLFIIGRLGFSCRSPVFYYIIISCLRSNTHKLYCGDSAFTLNSAYTHNVICAMNLNYPVFVSLYQISPEATSLYLTFYNSPHLEPVWN